MFTQAQEKIFMTDDLKHRLRLALQNPSYVISDDALQSSLMRELRHVFQ
jgi:hypothetical protein